MGKVTIYIKLVDGKLMYRDTEEDKGRTIKTSVDRGDKVTWKLDMCSGIKEITDIKLIGVNKKFFSEGPKKKDFNEWKAEVSKDAKGEISYEPIYVSCEGNEIAASMKVKASEAESKVKGDEPPIIKVNP